MEVMDKGIRALGTLSTLAGDRSSRKCRNLCVCGTYQRIKTAVQNL
jgi:hypothetical protein